MKITVTRDDGTTYDITKQVQYAYDVAVNSMDWGSGMLDIEEIENISALGVAAGYQVEFGRHAEIVWRHRREQDPNINRWRMPDPTPEELTEIKAHLLSLTKEVHDG